jgi:hypothetical protein
MKRGSARIDCYGVRATYIVGEIGFEFLHLAVFQGGEVRQPGSDLENVLSIAAKKIHITPHFGTRTNRTHIAF